MALRRSRAGCPGRGHDARLSAAARPAGKARRGVTATRAADQSPSEPRATGLSTTGPGRRGRSACIGKPPACSLPDTDGLRGRRTPLRDRHRARYRLALPAAHDRDGLRCSTSRPWPPPAASSPTGTLPFGRHEQTATMLIRAISVPGKQGVWHGQRASQARTHHGDRAVHVVENGLADRAQQQSGEVVPATIS